MATQQELLQLVIQTQGKGDVADLAKTLYDVGQSSSVSAPQAQALLEKIAAIGEQSSAASGLAGLKAELAETGDAFVAARLKVEQLEAQFDAADAPSARLVAQMEKARASVASLQAQFNSQQAAVTNAENALAAAGLSAENLDVTERELQASLAGVNAEAIELVGSFNAASAAGEREALTMSEISDRNAVLRAGFDQLKTLLLTFGSILAFEKIKEDVGEILDTGDKFAKWGAEFSAAFGSAQQGEDALVKVKELAEQTPLSLDQVTQAALQAKKEGLDPFDGSLQSIIATSLQYGGNAETVSTLITALGRSANQGGLNIRTLTTLQQQGIPAAQLLGNAMGKTAEEITELAKTSKLGSDAVATLISQLGKQNTGALDAQMQLLGTQVVKVKDDYDEFLELIAKSGAYDFVVGKLGDLNTAFKKGLEDGSLQEAAKAISDDLIAVGNALIKVTRFAVDHGTAIKNTAEAYVAFKVALLGVDLVDAAAKFAELTVAVKETGTAAEAAASGTGGIGKLNTAISKIPRNIQIGLAIVGAAEAIKSTLDVLDTTREYIALLKEQLHARQDDSDLQAQLVAKAAVVAQQTAAAANLQIATAEQLAAKNRDQSAAYVQSLQDAVRYYTAIQIQDKALGDSAGAQAASDKVKAYSAAIQDATTHQKELSDSIDESAGKVGTVVDRYDELSAHGNSAATAITGAFDGIDIGTPKGLTETVDILKQVSARGKDAADAVTGELVTALSKLDAADLSNVQKNLEDLFAQGKVSAQTLDTFLNATLQTSLKSIGLTAEQSGSSFTDAGKKIIADFTNVAANARSTSDQIQLAFATGLSKLSTGGEVEALKTQLQDAFGSGLISAQQLQSGMDAAGRKIAGLQAAAIEAGAGLDGMGTVGQTSSQKIVLALEDARDKVAASATQIAADITAALASGSDPTQLKANLKEAEAEIATFDTRIKAASESGDKGFKATAASARQAQQATTDAGDAAADASKQYDGFADTGEEGFADLTQAMANTRAEFSKISDAAAAFYDQSLKGNFELTTESDSAGAGFQRTAEAMAAAAKETTDQITNQRSQLQAEITDIDNVGTSSTAGFGQFGTSSDAAAAKMKSLVADIQNGTYDAGLLGQADLAPLQQALQEAIQRTQQLADAAKQAKDDFTSLGSQLQDDLDSASGNDTAVEDRRFQKQLADIKAAAQAAGELNSAQYRQDVQNANDLHALKLKQIQEQQAAQSGSTTSGGSSSPSSPSGVGGGSSDSGGGASLGTTHTVNVTINGTDLGNMTQAQAEQAAAVITPHVVRVIINAKRNGGF